jgi:hypothetical protein
MEIAGVAATAVIPLQIPAIDLLKTGIQHF